MTSDETFRYDPTPMNHAFPGQPDDCFDMVNQYGTYNIQKTADTDIVPGKDYYTKSGTTYTKVASPAKASLGDYYELVGVAKPINFLIVHKPALIKFDRHIAGPTVIGPDMNPDADASIVKYRKYGLVDGYANKRAGIYLSHK